MLIRNIKSSADGEAQKMLAMKLLEIEASNEAYLDKVKSAYRDPNKPPPVPPRYRDSTEVALDILGNQLKLITLFESWGIIPQQANAVVKGLKPDEVLKILSVPGVLKTKLAGLGKDYTDVKYITNIVERFIQNFDRTLGGTYENATDYIAHSYGSAARIFPSVDKVRELGQVLFAIRREYMNDTSRVGDIPKIDLLLNSLRDYARLMTEVEKKEKDPNDESTKKLKDLMLTGRIPLAIAIDEQLKIYSIMLSKIQSKEVNPQEANESFIKSNNLLSNPEINNLLSQITSLTQRNNQLAQDIEDAKISAERTQIFNYAFYPSGMTNVDAYTFRSILNKPSLSSTGLDMDKLTREHYLEKYNAGEMTYEQIKNDIKRAKEHPVKLQKDNVQNIDLRDKELKASIQNEDKENPNAVDKYKDNFDNQLEDMGWKINPTISSTYLKDMSEQIAEQSSDISNLGKEIGNYVREVDNIISEVYSDFKEKYTSEQRKNFIKMVSELNASANLIDELQQTDLDIDAIYERAERIPYEFEGPYIDYSQKAESAYTVKKRFGNNKKKLAVKKDDDITNETKSGNGIKNKVRIPQYQKLPVEYGGSISKNNLGFSHRKIKVGKGIGTEEKPKFIQFGKYLLNTPHLYNDSKLTLRFPSGGAIPTIKPINISEDFREFLIDLIENEKISQPLYKSVNEQEKAWFEKVCKGAGLVHKFNIKPKADDTESKELTRYKLLVGEVEAGNNNKDIIKELRTLILKFVKSGRMSKTDGNYMLTELSVI